MGSVVKWEVEANWTGFVYLICELIQLNVII